MNNSRAEEGLFLMGFPPRAKCFGTGRPLRRSAASDDVIGLSADRGAISRVKILLRSAVPLVDAPAHLLPVPDRKRALPVGVRRVSDARDKKVRLPTSFGRRFVGAFFLFFPRRRDARRLNRRLPFAVVSRRPRTVEITQLPSRTSHDSRLVMTLLSATERADGPGFDCLRWLTLELFLCSFSTACKSWLWESGGCHERLLYELAGMVRSPARRDGDVGCLLDCLPVPRPMFSLSGCAWCVRTWAWAVGELSTTTFNSPTRTMIKQKRGDQVR